MAESRGGKSEGKASYCGPGAVGCVETSGPVCVGAAQYPNGADQEVKGANKKVAASEQEAGQSGDRRA